MGMISAISEARNEVKSMSEKKEIVAAVYSGERPLFGEHDLIIKETKERDSGANLLKIIHKRKRKK